MLLIRHKRLNISITLVCLLHNCLIFISNTIYPFLSAFLVNTSTWNPHDDSESLFNAHLIKQWWGRCKKPIFVVITITSSKYLKGRGKPLEQIYSWGMKDTYWTFYWGHLHGFKKKFYYKSFSMPFGVSQSNEHLCPVIITIWKRKRKIVLFVCPLASGVSVTIDLWSRTWMKKLVLCLTLVDMNQLYHNHCPSTCNPLVLDRASNTANWFVFRCILSCFSSSMVCTVSKLSQRNIFFYWHLQARQWNLIDCVTQLNILGLNKEQSTVVGLDPKTYRLTHWRSTKWGIQRNVAGLSLYKPKLFKMYQISFPCGLFFMFI